MRTDIAELDHCLDCDVGFFDLEEPEPFVAESAGGCGNHAAHVLFFRGLHEIEEVLKIPKGQIVA